MRIAGEYYVINELKRLGFNAELMPKKGNNAPEIKIKDKTIQVRTRKDDRASWVLHEKAENLVSIDYFYAFVNLTESEKPIFRIVPSEVVANHCQNDHAQWLNTPGKKGQQRKDNTMRKFYDKEGKYLNAWHLLDQ